jgi:hypothetical protein
MNPEEKGNVFTFHFHNENSEECLLTNQLDEFTYPGLTLLDTTQDVNEFTGNVHVCAFYINRNGKLPFLEFMLQKHSDLFQDIFTFPLFEPRENMTIMEYSNKIVDIIYKSYKITSGSYEYKGCLKTENDVYLFYDFSTCNMGTHELYRNNDIWLVTMDEIVNQRNVCNFAIHSDVSLFFMNHPDLLYLRDKDNSIIETPIIVYKCASYEKTNFMLYFGESESTNKYLSAPHFYFTDYKHAIDKYLKTTQDESSTFGIVRVVLFLGKMTYYTCKDEVEQCQYDSVYIGSDITLHEPIWGVTKYEQQYPISSHYMKNNETYII